MTSFRQALSVFLSISVIASVMGLGGCSKKPELAQPGEALQAQPGQPQPGEAQPAQPGQQQAAPYVALTPDQLDQLVAPIALYPDALLAQILGAATFPDQIAAATGWLQQNKNLTGTALMQAVNEQPWDPSVKALTQFPSVLDNLAMNLSWTSSLGEAYHMQPADMMSAVQALRAKAQAAGNLRSGPQIKVVQQSPEIIVIQPANPQVVYVPQYNPTIVYGAPVATPGYSTAAVVTTAVLAFGIGIAVGAAMSNSCCGWGYSYWNCNWHGGTVVYKNNVYYGNSAWHGGVYGSSATAYGPYGAARAGTAYNSSTGTYARGASTTTAYGTQKVGQAYNPNTGAYAATHQTALGKGFYVDNLRAIDRLSMGMIQEGTAPHPAILITIAHIAYTVANAWDEVAITVSISDRVEKQLQPKLIALLDLMEADPVSVCAALDEVATAYAQAVKQGLDSDFL